MAFLHFIVLSVIILSFYEALAIFCPRISKPAYGRFDVCPSNLRPGDYCSFKCDEGFKLQGHNRVRCITTSGGGARWGDDPPTCKANRCIAPDIPRNGSLVSCEPRIGSWEGRCTFKCNKGFNITGDAQIRCLDIGGSTQWSDIPGCTPPACPTLKKPKYGDFKRCDSTVPVIGTVCYVECHDHYKLNGTDNTVTCLEGRSKEGVPYGKWNRKVPICAGGVRCSYTAAMLVSICLVLGLLH